MRSDGLCIVDRRRRGCRRLRTGALAQDRGANDGVPSITGRIRNRSQSSELVKAVAGVDGGFRDVRVAEAEGYGLQFGCVSGPDFGAMGMHFVNGALVGDG